MKFCSDYSFAPISSIDLFCMYVSVTCRRLNPRTVVSYLSGISRCLEPSFPSVNLLSNSPAVRRVLKACLKKFSPPVRRAQPCLLSDFDIVFKSTSSSYDDLLFVCLLTFGFAGLHRLGEITVPDSTVLRDPQASIFRSSLLVSSPPTHFEYILPYSKVNQFHLGQTIVIYSNPQQSACAVTHLLKYLSLRDLIWPTLTPLFLTSAGESPTRSWFLRRFRPLFPFQKTGHSLRSGGATYLANRGVDLSLIKEAGRWSSSAFKPDPSSSSCSCVCILYSCFSRNSAFLSSSTVSLLPRTSHISTQDRTYSLLYFLFFIKSLLSQASSQPIASHISPSPTLPPVSSDALVFEQNILKLLSSS